MEAEPLETLAPRFEATGRGRFAAVLVAPDERGVPIVRTTTKYRDPAQRFSPAQVRLAEQIQRGASLPFAFNNALVERYTNLYTTMGAHSDQALDLADDSFVAVFSCYERPEHAHRVLAVEPKGGGAQLHVPLLHQRAVVFSLATNRRFRHKIVLPRGAPDNAWLGFTFRTSKTFVRSGELTLATEEEQQTFFELRRRENREADFRYPSIGYTLSDSDLLPPR